MDEGKRRFSSQCLLTPSLNGQEVHRHEGGKDQGTRGIDRRRGVGRASVDGDQRGTETGDTVQATGDTGSGAAVRGREDLRGVGVQDTVDDVLEEGYKTGADELDAGVARYGEAEGQHAGDQGGDSHGALAADVLYLDGVAGQNGARKTDDRSDGVVAVGDVDRATRVTEILGQESVEQRVAHTDGAPAEPEENRGDTQALSGEQRYDAFHRKLGEESYDDVANCELLFLLGLGVAADFVKDLVGQPGFGLVLIGDSVHRSQIERASQEKGGVESQTTTNNVRGNAPERSTDAETQEQGVGGESPMRLGDVEFIRQSGQSQGNSLHVISVTPRGRELCLSLILTWSQRP